MNRSPPSGRHDCCVFWNARVDSGAEVTCPEFSAHLASNWHLARRIASCMVAKEQVAATGIWHIPQELGIGFKAFVVSSANPLRFYALYLLSCLHPARQV